MKIGFLFPGQGTQSVGMGKDLYEKYECYQNIYKKVQSITDVDIANISFKGPEEVLNKTKYTQLAILTNSLAILEILNENNIYADMSAGLSLGEYTALINANAISFEEGVKLVQRRGEYMQELLPEGDWQMVAMIGINENMANEICSRVKNGFIAPSNYNCTGQIVLSGEKNAVEEAIKIANEIGVKKNRILKTDGPFHTEKLKESSKALRMELNNIHINKFEKKVFKNIDGEIYTKDDDVRDILANHIINPVKFSKILDNMVQNGIDTFIEVGPRKSIIRICKKDKNRYEIKYI